MNSCLTSLTVAALLTGSLAVPAAAHHLTVAASAMTATPGEETSVSISWGHALPQDQPIDAALLERYELRAPSGQIVALQTDGVSWQTNQVRLQDAGVYQVVAARRPSLLTVVVDAEGKHRHHRGPRSSVPDGLGRIDHTALSHQYAKSMIVCGSGETRPAAPWGLPLEIVPLEAPADWRAGRELRFQVLLNGRPAPREEMVISVVGLHETLDAHSDTDADPGRPRSPVVITDEQGVAVVPAGLAGKGIWALRVRTRRPVDESVEDQHDVETHTATLSLEVRS